MTENILTPKEVAAMLNITVPTLFRLTHKGTVKGFKIGAKIRYKYSDIMEALKEITAPVNGN